MQTIAEAKTYLRENYEKGATCPCCSQLVKKYPYHLNATVATTLIKMYELHQQGKKWVHVNTEIRPRSGGYFSIAQNWGFIAGKENEDETKRVSGHWTLTARGIDFVLNRIRVPRTVFVVVGKRVGFSEDEINITEALGTKFDYRELMGNYYPSEPPAAQKGLFVPDKNLDPRVSALIYRQQSQSDPNTTYTIRYLPQTGEYRCDCPAFIFNDKVQCKHIKKVIEQRGSK